jgi:hypothetical protein
MLVLFTVNIGCIQHYLSMNKSMVECMEHITYCNKECESRGRRLKCMLINYIECSLPIRLFLLERLVELIHGPMSSFSFKVVNSFIDGMSSGFVRIDPGNEKGKIGPYLPSLQ